MVLIAKYQLAETPEHIQIVINSTEAPLYCKRCGRKMHRHGCRLRKVLYLNASGEVKAIVYRIQRFCCRQCHKTHDELPNCIIPYKRYGLNVFEQIFEVDNQYINIGLELGRVAKKWMGTLIQGVSNFIRAKHNVHINSVWRANRKKGWLGKLVLYYYNYVFPPVISG